MIDDNQYFSIIRNTFLAGVFVGFLFSFVFIAIVKVVIWVFV